MEALIPRFTQFIQVKSASDKHNQLVRAVDMLWNFFQNQHKSKLVLIDVYSNLAFAFAFVFSSLSWLFRKPYVLFLHGGDLPVRYQRSTVIFSFILSRAEKIVVPSNYLAQYFTNLGFAVQVIPNFIEIQNYPFEIRKKSNLKLLYIRGFGKPYNPLMTLSGVKLLVKKGYRPHLTMLGNADEAWYEAVINFIIENQLDNYVEVLPKMSREGWVALSRDYDIMISNPDIDNTPVSLIEGLALGLVIVSTEVGGVPFLFPDEHVNFVPKEDSAALADQIIALYNSPEKMERMSRRGRLFACQFDWSQVGKQWKDLFNSIDE
ncbi:MAG: glycosyltransferase family 4 protein [bacterium]|nr:glycosyltransferase family 4 protein [bacterium]